MTLKDLRMIGIGVVVGMMISLVWGLAQAVNRDMIATQGRVSHGR